MTRFLPVLAFAFCTAGIACTAGITGTSGTVVGTSEAPIRIESQPSRAYLDAHNIPSHGVALEGYCPVAYFAANKPLRGKSEHSSVHADITYYFVSAGAKEAFDADPEKYLPAYGGWCAFGMSVEDKFPVDPTNFAIVDGRLMLFLKNPGVDALELWNDGNVTESTAKANKHWKSVQGG
jgi:YHS domain-containing protein